MANGPTETVAAKEGQQEDGQQAPTNERQIADQLTGSQKRLKQLMEVNRKLHSALADKKLHAAALKKDNDGLMWKLEAREVEEVGRHKQLEDLQQKLQENQTSQQQETLSLQKAVLTLEERIENLNEENLKLGDRHKENKQLISDQQTAMKLLQRRAKELSRHIEFMAGHLNEAQFMEAPSIATLRDDSTSERRETERPKNITDFQRLPGLNLEKLLGEDAIDVLNFAGTAGRVDSRGASPELLRPPSGERQSIKKERSGERRAKSGRSSGSAGQGQELGRTGSGSRPGSGASGSGTGNGSAAGVASPPILGSDDVTSM